MLSQAMDATNGLEKELGSWDGGEHIELGKDVAPVR
jgi:hypothetical protein